jgi:hypothetical protein
MQRCAARVFLLGLAFLLTLILKAPERALGQVPGFGSSGNLYQWAYSPAFGTGAYQIGDEETCVITFKPRIKLRETENQWFRFNMRLPVSVGQLTQEQPACQIVCFRKSTRFKRLFESRF